MRLNPNIDKQAYITFLRMYWEPACRNSINESQILDYSLNLFAEPRPGTGWNIMMITAYESLAQSKKNQQTPYREGINKMGSFAKHHDFVEVIDDFTFYNGVTLRNR
ncbi:MAG: hypothetical protein ACXWV5_05640 [Flavitalea sp.]